MPADRRPLVLGHRGARAYAPMNTLPGFALAMQQGADGVELDVWRTADGHLVVLHDDTVDDTTDGRGSIHAMTLEMVKTLDAGTWFGAAYAGTPVPTLDEVFAALPSPALINVEIKKTDNETADTDGIEALVAACIDRHAAHDRVIVSSFSLWALHHFHAVSRVPLALGYLYMADQEPAAVLAGLGDLANSVHHLHPYHEPLTHAVVQAITETGRQVNTWTVNDAGRMRELLDMGVQGIITDVPDVGRAVVDAWLHERDAGSATER